MAGVDVPHFDPSLSAESDQNWDVEINDAEFLYDGRLVAIEGYAVASGSLTVKVQNISTLFAFLYLIRRDSS